MSDESKELIAAIQLHGMDLLRPIEYLNRFGGLDLYITRAWPGVYQVHAGRYREHAKCEFRVQLGEVSTTNMTDSRLYAPFKYKENCMLIFYTAWESRHMQHMVDLLKEIFGGYSGYYDDVQRGDFSRLAWELPDFDLISKYVKMKTITPKEVHIQDLIADYLNHNPGFIQIVG